MKKHHVVYVAVAIIVLLILAIFPKWVVDDAFISFRYAYNFINYGEFTYNIGENPVEGYTGILMPLGIALGLNLGITPKLMSHLIGILSFLVVLITLHNILTRFCSRSFIYLSMLFLFVTAPFIYTHVFSGLETLPFIALLLVSSLQLHTIISLRSSSFVHYSAIALSLFALSLCRPEGAIYTIIVMCILSGTALLRITSRRKFVISSLFFLILPGIFYFVWRWQYYGYLLPNTFYAKQDASFVYRSFSDLKFFCKEYLFLPAVFVVSTCMVYRDKTIAKHQQKQQFLKTNDLLTLGSLILFGIIIVVQYLRSNLGMDYSYRFYAPLYPIALVLFGWILSASYETARLIRQSKPLLHIAIILGLCVTLLIQVAFHMNWLLSKEMPFALNYKTRLAEMHHVVGRYIKKQLPDSEWLIVHNDAGVIPYYSELKTIDFGGLNDEFLAHNKKASIEDRVNYFFSKKPGAVVFTTYEWDQVNHGPEANAIISDPRFKEFKLVKKYNNTTGLKYYEFVFIKENLLEQNKVINLANKATAGDGKRYPIN